jgi:hypothetical protein
MRMRIKMMTMIEGRDEEGEGKGRECVVCGEIVWKVESGTEGFGD